MKTLKSMKMSLVILFTIGVIGLVYALDPSDYIEEWASQSSNRDGSIHLVPHIPGGVYAALTINLSGEKWVLYYKYFQVSSDGSWTSLGSQQSTEERLNEWKSKMGLCTENDDCTNQVGDEEVY